MKTKFKYKLKTIVNVQRAYPSSSLSKLFLLLNQSRKAKTFTPYQLEIIETLAAMLDFDIEYEIEKD